MNFSREQFLGFPGFHLPGYRYFGKFAKESLLEPGLFSAKSELLLLRLIHIWMHTLTFFTHTHQHTQRAYVVLFSPPEMYFCESGDLNCPAVAPQPIVNTPCLLTEWRRDFTSHQNNAMWHSDVGNCQLENGLCPTYFCGRFYFEWCNVAILLMSLQSVLSANLMLGHKAVKVEGLNWLS